MLLLLVSSIHSVPLPQKVLISPEDVQDEFRTITMFLSKQFGERNWSLFMSAWVWRASTTVSTNVVSLFFWCFSIFLEVILNIFWLLLAFTMQEPCHLAGAGRAWRRLWWGSSRCGSRPRTWRRAGAGWLARPRCAACPARQSGSGTPAAGTRARPSDAPG